MEESSAMTIARRIKDCNPIIRSLVARDIMTKNYIKVSIFRPSVKKAIPNGNGPALGDILDSISLSHVTLKNLSVLCLTNV